MKKKSQPEPSTNDWSQDEKDAANASADYAEYRDRPVFGAGRGKQGGPTAKELKMHEQKENAGIYTADKGQPPMDPEMAPSTPKMRRSGKHAGEVGKSWDETFSK